MVSTTRKIQTRSEYDQLRLDATNAQQEASNAKGEVHRCRDEVKKAIAELNANDPEAAKKTLMDLVASIK